MSQFFQQGPQLYNQFDDDALLQSYLRRILPSPIYSSILPDLKRLGQRVITDILTMAHDAETQPPELIQYDPWGKRIDTIRVAGGWKQLDQVSAEEGLVALGYERPYDEFSRVYQFAKLYLFTPSSAIYTCPLAMTDGAARLIEVHGSPALQDRAYCHLTSRNPSSFWTSGQWMTERTGGSDVGRSQTIARWQNEYFCLYGDKWFTSATTAQMAMTLARIETIPTIPETQTGFEKEGERAAMALEHPGLSLFYLETRLQDGSLNHIRINRLKEKFGTRALPTAELTLNGTIAQAIGKPGEGVKIMSTLFNITRIYNACSAVSLMRRGIALAKDYAQRRMAFGKKLSEQPLHIETLARLEVEWTGCFLMTFYVVELLGKKECNQATPEESAILRLLTPLLKLYTAKQAVKVNSEILESFGGAGYIEDTGLPKLLRDAQVLAIWEGTTNVLSLDALRAIQKEQALFPLLQDISQRLSRIHYDTLSPCIDKAEQALQALQGYAIHAESEGLDYLQAGARDLAYSLSRTVIAALLLEHAQWSAKEENDTRYALIVRRWCDQGLVKLQNPRDSHREETRHILFGS